MRPRSIIVAGLVVILAVTSVFSRALPEDNRTTQLKSAAPAYCAADHRAGRLRLTVANNATIGFGFAQGSHFDCFTGEPLMSAEFPQGSNISYLFSGALWIGAVVGTDTLVSVGADGWQSTRDFVPEAAPVGNMQQRLPSNLNDPYEIVSEQDFVATYSDTIQPGINDLRVDVIDGRTHIPLNLDVTQESYAWSLPVLRDMIFLDYRITNIGATDLDEVYIGYYVDADVGWGGSFSIAQDDITGYIETATNSLPCVGEYEDTVRIAWIADNDGDPSSGVYGVTSATGVTGTKILSVSPQQHLSYNWWISNGTPSLDFGPTERANVRDFTTGGTGTPEGDRNKYWQLSNGSIDYDQAFTATIGADDSVWLSPPLSDATQFSRALDTRYLLSAGPYSIPAGQTLHWSVAYLGGNNFHVDPSNFESNMFTYRPTEFYADLNFSDFALKSQVAERVYDNPGVDTDGDAFFGEFVLCDGDTIWVRGDGVPDWNPNVKPHAPTVWADKSGSSIIVRFNGLVPETELDAISSANQFEGYTLYLSDLSGTTGPSIRRLSVFDRNNFVKYHYTASGWQADFHIYSLEELRCAYGGSCNDTDFYPLFYTPSSPYVVTGENDSLLYFEKYGYNNSSLFGTSGFTKRYPNEPYPSTLDPSQAQPNELTEDGYFKHFEYQYIITGLSADREYEVAVTSFEFGSPESILPGLESDTTFISTSSQLSCCVGVRGDINGDGHVEADPLDLAFLVDFMFSFGTAPTCAAEADLNGLGDGVDPTDLAILIDFLFSGGPPPVDCE